jgi:hypothetical protein
MLPAAAVTSVVLNVLPDDKTLHHSLPLGQRLELDQCVIVQIR